MSAAAPPARGQTTAKRERVLHEATFSPGAPTYFTMTACLGLIPTIIGIVLIPVAAPLSLWYWGKYYSRLRVVLTSRDLKVHRGILNREEKSVPLEKITDLAVYQGPIMRYMGLKGIRVETAGQSNQEGALVRVVGIEDTDGFRDMVLNQRDRIADNDGVPPPPPVSAPAPAPAAPVTETPVVEVLSDIRDTLKRIEERLGRQDGP